jgi:hypothetical protein
MKSKKADVAVTLLVFMAVALAGAASMIFLTSERGIKERIVDARFIDEIYLIDGKLDFYINEIIENSAENSKNSENFREDFINSFKEEATIYGSAEKDLSTYFAEMQEQIANVQVEEITEGYKITLNFDFIMIMAREPFAVIHKYKKTFEKEIPKG